MPDEEFESAFREALEGAMPCSDQARRLVEAYIPDGTRFIDVPEASVQKLHLASTVNFRAGLVCLHNPETSVASLALLRGLLEAWSHLVFIGDPTAGGSAKCRALRYERGSAREWADSIQGAPQAEWRDEWEARLTKRIHELDELWTQSECSRSNRTRKHVETTLRALGQVSGFEWVPMVWRSSSAVAHMNGADFAFGDEGLVWAQPTNRVAWFNQVCAAYFSLTEAALAVLSAPTQTILTFHESGRALAESPDLLQIAEQSEGSTKTGP